MMKKEIQYYSQPSNVSMADSWYEIANKTHFWFLWRLEEIKKKLPKSIFRTDALEIGCGSGVVKETLEEFYDSPIDGCDLNLLALKQLQRSRGSLYYYDILEKREEFKERFNTIFLLDTLEHIHAPIDFLKAVSFHLAKRGNLIINLPAFQFLYSPYDSSAGHVKRYDINSIKKELEAAGLKVVSWKYWGALLVPFALARKLFFFSGSEKKIIELGFSPKIKILDLLLRLFARIETKIKLEPCIGSSIILLVQKDL